MKGKTIVLHIPHSSRSVAEGERSGLLLDEAALELELDVMTDSFTDRLFPQVDREWGRVVFPVSRLVCDPERFPEDKDEPMSAKGMGAIYISTSAGSLLRSLPNLSERRRILDAWYFPHHTRLAEEVESCLVANGHCLVIDCHSFPDLPLPYEDDQITARPDFCIGTDAYHTLEFLAGGLVSSLRASGYSASINFPFAGALVPLRFYRRDTRVQAVMIEVNRKLYMDQALQRPSSNFGTIRTVIEGLLR